MMRKNFLFAGFIFLFVTGLFGQSGKIAATTTAARFYDQKCERIADREACEACAEMQLLKKIYTALSYPQSAKENQISGEVIAQFTVKADGAIADIAVIQGLGYGCDEATVEAIKSVGKFVPGQTEGKPTDTVMTLPVRFRVEHDRAVNPAPGQRNQ